MRILVTFAVEAEFAPWRKLRSFRCISKSPFELHDAEVGPHMIRVLLTGIGWECARRTANPVLNDAFGACISSGLAGGLKGTYRAGDILAFKEVGEVGGERSFHSNLSLTYHAGKQGALVAPKLLTSKRLVVTAEEKRRVGLFGDAVDMESFRIMAAAQGRGIPALSLRAISDTVEEDLPMDFTEHLSESGQIVIGKVLSKVVLSPQTIPSMIRFGARSKHVAEKLAGFLDDFFLGLTPNVSTSEHEVLAQ